MTSTVRWNLLALVVVAGLVAALWPRDPAPTSAAANPSTSTSVSAPAEAEADLAGPRETAALAPCPTAAPGAVETTGPLAGLTLDCLGADGTVDLGTALAGRPVLLNLWTYWCPPCADELPALQTLAERAGDALTVLTVHSEVRPGAALERLADYGVRLPGVQDPTGRVGALVGAAQVFPTTVLLDADGQVVTLLYEPYTDPDAIAADVERYLGVDL